MKTKSYGAKSKRTKIFTLITSASILVLVALNLLLSLFTYNNTFFLDMTFEGLYSLSGEMKSECDEIFEEIGKSSQGKKVKLTFCTDPDYLIDSSKTRLTYFMAKKLENRYPELVEVETVNINLNPSAVSKYKTTSLSEITPSNIIVSYGDRYRIASADSFWAQSSTDSYYNGEYRMASLILSVTAISHPVAYFVTDHAETYYDPENPESEMSIKMAAFADLLIERGLKIKTLNLSEADSVPEDCALLIINNPQEDFTYDKSQLDSFEYISDTEKLDRYMAMNQGAIIVAKDYGVKLPVFETFLYEWGFSFGDTVIKDESSSLDNEQDPNTDIIAVYSTDETSYAYAIYGEFADLSTAPITIFSNSGPVYCSYGDGKVVSEAGTPNTTKQYASFITTTNGARLYYRDENGSDYFAGDAEDVGSFDLAAVTVREELDQIANEMTYSYLFCVNTPEFLSDRFIGDASYANYDIVSAVIDNISRIDKTASMDLGGLSGNSSSTGGKMLVNSSMSGTDKSIYSNKFANKDKPSEGYQFIKFNHALTTPAIVVYTVIVASVPFAIAIIGIVVSIKRKNL